MIQDNIINLGSQKYFFYKKREVETKHIIIIIYLNSNLILTLKVFCVDWAFRQSYQESFLSLESKVYRVEDTANLSIYQDIRWNMNNHSFKFNDFVQIILSRDLK